MIRRYTVIGNPIEHSKSPTIHALFAEQTQREVEYTRTLATDDNLAAVINAFAKSGGNGFNVTIPFKQSVLSLCDKLGPCATRANAVNTVVISPDGRLTGYNTDGSGLLRDLMGNLKFEVAGARILIAGAGGSTRGILHPLLAQAPAEIVIANRTLDKAKALAQDFAEEGHIVATEYPEIPASGFDLVVNATSLSLENQKPSIPDACITSTTVAYDLMYGRDTVFMQWARSLGAASVHDGLGMLLEQAADAFFLWEEVRPKTRLIGPRL